VPDSTRGLREAIASGTRHGISREGVCVCMYFHTTVVLRKFVKRTFSHHIRFKLFTRDAVDSLSASNVASLWRRVLSVRFDRNDTSNIGDADHVGLASIIDA
jgi:hypothetical protein